MEKLLNKLLQPKTETEVLEYKEAKNQFDKNKLGKYFSALSNEANLRNKSCAWLLLGVNDSGQITGTSITDSQINEYKTEIAGHTSPVISFKDAHRVVINKKTVIMLEIPPAPSGMPVAWKGHYYGRDGESLGALNITELETIRNQIRTEDWSAQLVPEASLSDLSDEAIQKARVQFVRKNPSLTGQISSWDDITFLNKAKITIQGKITNTAILLLGRPESEHFINPAAAKISWILKDRDNIEKDYEHFNCPLIVNVDSAYNKIRNLKYRYLQQDSLFPDEVEQYDPYIIREALNNCIAHQDYTLGGKINIVEKEDGTLFFSNMGSFIPVSVENVIQADAPEPRYRNPFLASAMVGLNMIDTIGGGIKKMFIIQREKFFPLPDYDISEDRVQVKITGKVIDMNYALKLAQMPELNLDEIILLDKVSKNKPMNGNEIKILKSKNLIEGRKPNFHISLKVAKKTDQKKQYIKLKGIENEYINKIIIDCIKDFGEIKRVDLENVLMSKLSENLDIKQKKNKIKNALQKLRMEGLIEPHGKSWKMSK